MKIVIIQRACAVYRESFLDLLNNKFELVLFSKNKNLGKIKVPKNIREKKYYKKNINFSFGNYNIYPFLFFDLWKTNPDTIVSEGGQNTINNLSLLLYSKIFNKKYFIWDLGRSHIQEKRSLFRNLYNMLYRCIIRNSFGIFTYNTQGKKYFKEKYPSKEIFILHNTIDTNDISKIKSNIDCIKHNTIKNKFSKFDRKVLYVGAINTAKNIESLVDVMRLLGDKYCLIILGDGKENYVFHLKQLFRNQNVFFEGYKNLSETAYYYSVSDFTILPGLGGLAIIQSLAFGVPVLVNKADGSEFDLIINGETGYIYHNLNDLINFITTQLPFDIERMKKSSTNHIYNNFTIQNMVDNFINGIQTVKTID